MSKGIKIQFAALSYRTKLTVAIMLTAAIVVALTCLAFLAYEATTARRAIAEEQLALAQFTAQNTTAAVVFYDRAAALENLNNFHLTPQVRHAAIFATGMDEALAVYHREGLPLDSLERPSLATKSKITAPEFLFGQETLHLTVPILVDDELLGHLEMEVGLDALRTRMLTYLGIGAMVFSLVLVIAFLIARLLSFLVSRPVERLSAAMTQVKETRDYSRHVAKSGSDEFGRLIDSFNAMLDEIARRDTRMEQLVAQLTAARDEAQAASVAKSQFLANMSHELRTPLNAVIGYTEIIEEDLEDAGIDSADDDLRRIKASANHLLSLINDVLDLSKIEAGRMELDPHDFPLSQVLDEAIATISPIARRRGNQVEVDAVPDLMLYSDSTKLKQALLNLLSNACKFTENGRITLSVRRCLKAQRECIALSVADTGLGMSQQQIDGLFQAFVQADPSITRKYGGTGLGLAITQRFVQLLGGDIEVSSQPNAGSVFTLRIPLRLDAGSTGVGSLAKARAHLRSGEANARPAPLILVIDDAADARDLLERWLPRLGYEVVTAASGSEGLVAARHLQPAAVLLDATLAAGAGHGLIEQLRKQAHARHLPVIMCGGHAETQDWPATQIDLALVKPLDRAALGAALALATQQPSGHVLLVDDEAGFRDQLARDLRDGGFNVSDTGDGATALALLRGAPIDAVIIDLMMPDMDGNALIDRIEKDARIASVPRILYSAKTLAADERAHFEAKAAAVIAKGPRGQMRLYECLRQILADQAAAAAARWA